MLVIRLSRIGRKGLSIYSIVVTNKRSSRDGKYIEKLGTYNASVNPTEVRINEALIIKWLNLGAKISDTVRSILSKSGILLRRSLDKCVKKGTLDDPRRKAKISEWESSNSKKKRIFNFTFLN